MLKLRSRSRKTRLRNYFWTAVLIAIPIVTISCLLYVISALSSD